MMKAAITVVVLVGGFFLCGFDTLLRSAVTASEARHAKVQTASEDNTLEGFVKQVQSAFDPTWVENFNNADLITHLKAASGSEN